MSDESPINLGSFQQWDDIVQEKIAYFLSHLPVKARQQYDYSLESLITINAWLLKRYTSPLDLGREADKDLLEGAIFYIGETYRQHLHGYWNVHFADLEPEFEYGERPVIEGFYKRVAISPAYRVFEAVESRDEWFLNQSLKSLIRLISVQRTRNERKNS
jgi:hypothetical protein